MKQLLLIIQLKWVQLRRFLLQTPFPYVFLLSAMAVLLVYVLLKIDLPATWQSLAGAVVAQLFLCSRIHYSEGKRLFLRQYRGMYPLSVFLDSLLLSIPFALINGYLWAAAVATSFLYPLFALPVRRNAWFRPVLPSPFFMKSGYLWHAQRYLLPVIWVLILLFILIAWKNDNYNLGIVMFTGWALAGFLATIMEKEDTGFVQMYVSVKHFITRTLVETLYNTALYLFPLVVLLLFFFPVEWGITLCLFAAVMLLDVQLLWTKYACFPSAPLAGTLFFFGLLLQITSSITIYGIAIVPVYTLILYFFFRKNIRSIKSGLFSSSSM